MSIITPVAVGTNKHPWRRMHTTRITNTGGSLTADTGYRHSLVLPTPLYDGGAAAPGLILLGPDRVPRANQMLLKFLGAGANNATNTIKVWGLSKLTEEINGSDYSEYVGGLLLSFTAAPLGQGTISLTSAILTNGDRWVDTSTLTDESYGASVKQYQDPTDGAQITAFDIAGASHIVMEILLGTSTAMQALYSWL